VDSSVFVGKMDWRLEMGAYGLCYEIGLELENAMNNG
jgi:hypothetical protein